MRFLNLIFFIIWSIKHFSLFPAPLCALNNLVGPSCYPAILSHIIIYVTYGNNPTGIRMKKSTTSFSYMGHNGNNANFSWGVYRYHTILPAPVALFLCIIIGVLHYTGTALYVYRGSIIPLHWVQPVFVSVMHYISETN